MKEQNGMQHTLKLREKATHLLYILTYNTQLILNSEVTEFNELVETRNKKMPDLINAPQKAVRKLVSS